MRILVILSSLILALPLNSFGQPILPASTQDLAQKYVGKRKNKALLIGVIQDGATAYYPFGQRSASDKSAPDAQTVFELGAATSVFTTSFMYYESLQGRFDLGDL
ncbi:MAG: serine hydrolase, partial [Phaeodactylibacter sp.]|nr:serine hydrolase [Phaeodactylibacter sp.]